MYLFCIWIGKFAQISSRLTGKNGTAIPGYIIERMYGNFLPKALGRLPDGVIIITGTNGKTTTTKLVAETLQGCGKKVLTNKSGSNFVRGAISQVVSEADWFGRLPKDVAILEQDEAYAVHFVKGVRPRGVVVLNVMRDQMDRFGEIDHTAKLLANVTNSAQEFVVLNANDGRVVDMPSKKTTKRYYFSVATALKSMFPNDDEWHTVQHAEAGNVPEAFVQLKKIEADKMQYSLDKTELKGTLKVSGLHNSLNAAAALATCRLILPATITDNYIFETMQKVRPAFGRGEVIKIGNKSIRLQLVKNPAGFTQSLKIMDTEKFNQVMLAINDAYADGRDMSWLWDVDFSCLADHTSTYVSGVRAYDMAVRMKYDNCRPTRVEIELPSALKHFIGRLPNSGTGIIFCTYTAMLQLRKELERSGHAKAVR